MRAVVVIFAFLAVATFAASGPTEEFVVGTSTPAGYVEANYSDIFSDAFKTQYNRVGIEVAPNNNKLQDYGCQYIAFHGGVLYIGSFQNGLKIISPVNASGQLELGLSLNTPYIYFGGDGEDPYPHVFYPTWNSSAASLFQVTTKFLGCGAYNTGNAWMIYRRHRCMSVALAATWYLPGSPYCVANANNATIKTGELSDGKSPNVNISMPGFTTCSYTAVVDSLTVVPYDSTSAKVSSSGATKCDCVADGVVVPYSSSQTTTFCSKKYKRGHFCEVTIQFLSGAAPVACNGQQ